MGRTLRGTPRWALPFLILSGVAAAGVLLMLIAYAVFAALVIGGALVAKDLPAVPTKYEEDPPVKAWDAIWGWATFANIDGGLRVFLLLTAGSAAGIVIAAGNAGEASGEFAWGLLGGTAVLSGIESFMRHRKMPFKVEAPWVLLECVIVGVIAITGGADWLLGIAVACGVEVAGAVAGLGVAASRATAPRRATPCGCFSMLGGGETS
jgi:hypothetical protein